MHEIFNTNFSSPGKYMPESWRAVAACCPTGGGQEELPPAQAASPLPQPSPPPPAGTEARELSFACKGKNFKPRCVATSQWNKGTLNPSDKKHISSNYNSNNINYIVQHEEYHRASSAPLIPISGWPLPRRRCWSRCPTATRGSGAGARGMQGSIPASWGWAQLDGADTRTVGASVSMSPTHPHLPCSGTRRGAAPAHTVAIKKKIKQRVGSGRVTGALP